MKGKRKRDERGRERGRESQKEKLISKGSADGEDCARTEKEATNNIMKMRSRKY